MQNTNRLLSLDVFRGITVAGMMVVNLPGNQYVYPLLEHSAWHGCTLADLVFPFFIFILGVALVLLFSKKLNAGVAKNTLLLQALKRGSFIFLIGLFLNAFPNHFDLATLRFYGVLQRIGCCYIFAACLFLTCDVRQQIIWVIGLLIGYWLVMALIPVPGYGTMNYTAEGNVGAWIEGKLWNSEHLYGKFYDPEGFLSTFPSFATVLMGNLTGFWLLTQHTAGKKVQGMVLLGAVCVGLGWIWGLWFPINKSLWTSSYVLWTGGIALWCFALCYWLIEIKRFTFWTKPFDVLGLNALLAYSLHILGLKMQLHISVLNSDGSSENLRSFLTEHLFGWASLTNASLLYAISSMMFWLMVVAALELYKKCRSPVACNRG